MKPENQFISGVHAHLRDVHHEKTNNPFRSGMADVWYSGCNGDVWVEYKFLPSVPAKGAITAAVTERQKQWLSDRYCEGRTVYVILGTTHGGVVLRPTELDTPLTVDAFVRAMMTRKQLAEFIRSITGPSPCRTPKASSPPQKSVRLSTASF